MKTTQITLAALSLALACSLAQAASWSAPNQAGGRIVLTDRVCPGFKLKDGLLQSYVFTGEGAKQEGCWTLLDGRVHMSLDGGGVDNVKVFETSEFTSDAPKKVAPAAPSKTPSVSL